MCADPLLRPTPPHSRSQRLCVSESGAVTVAGTHLAYEGVALPVNSTLIHLAIGGALMAAVYAGGPLSGGHFNPAVSLAAMLRGSLTPTTMASYVVSQLSGSVLAFGLSHSLGVAAEPGHSWTPGFPQPHASTVAAFAAEFVFSFALCGARVQAVGASPLAGSGPRLAWLGA